MNVRVNFDGSSFLAGTIVATWAAGVASAWYLALVPLLLIDLPGPKLEYSSKEGFKFYKWKNPE